MLTQKEIDDGEAKVQSYISNCVPKNKRPSSHWFNRKEKRKFSSYKEATDFIKKKNLKCFVYKCPICNYYHVGHTIINVL